MRKKNKKKSIVDELLNKILKINNTFDKSQVKNILVLYEEQVFFIGDTCIKFGMLGLFKSFFPKAEIDINWLDEKFSNGYLSLLSCNPYVRNTSNVSWEELKFSEYDIVLTISHQEQAFLQMLAKNYGTNENSFPNATAFFSMSRIALNLTTRTLVTALPPYIQLCEYALAYTHEPQLFISEEETEWANKWLRQNGLKEQEDLFIVIDSASSAKKLIPQNVYKELMLYLLGHDKSKILIFDDRGEDKESIYENLIGKEHSARIIYASALGLRRDLAILSSKYTKLIFGPCTGLLHCASGIFNILQKSGFTDRRPSIVVYTGEYEGEENNAALWWNTSIVDCLILRDTTNGKEIIKLHELTENEKTDSAMPLSCDEYTAELFIKVLKNLGS